MHSEKMIANVDAGKNITVKKSWIYLISFITTSGVIAWLISVIFWISGTDKGIAENHKNITQHKIELIEIEMWRSKHTDNHNELIYNLARLMEANGIEWKVLKK